jgi:hypothetical protein
MKRSRRSNPKPTEIFWGKRTQSNSRRIEISQGREKNAIRRTLHALPQKYCYTTVDIAIMFIGTVTASLLISITAQSPETPSVTTFNEITTRQ